jgi:hypothetical protein
MNAAVRRVRARTRTVVGMGLKHPRDGRPGHPFALNRGVTVFGKSRFTTSSAAAFLAAA